jgi:hypothetical protein
MNDGVYCSAAGRDRVDLGPDGRRKPRGGAAHGLVPIGIRTEQCDRFGNPAAGQRYTYFPWLVKRCTSERLFRGLRHLSTEKWMTLEF